MEMKKSLVYLVAFATLFYLLSPVGLLKAQTCDPDALSAVKNPQNVLRFGARNSAVRNLQACLIEAGYNIPAGATGYYGTQTRSAVKEFYAEWYGAWHGNWVGPQGVSQLVSLVKGVQEEVVTEQPEQPTTGISPDLLAQVLQKIQAGDIQGALSLLLAALGGAQLPPTTPEQPTAEQPTQPELAGEATVEVRLAAVPGGGVVIKEGESADVLGVRVISKNAPSEVQRLRMVLTSNVVPTKLFNSFDLYVGNEKVASLPANEYNRIKVSEYEYTFTGLKVRVPANGEVTLVVRVNVNPTVDSGDINNAGTLSLEVRSGDLRAVDGAGIQHTPSVTGTVKREFSVEKITPSGVALVIYKDQASPASNNFAADANRDVKNVELVRFVLRADNDTLKVLKIEILPTFSNLTVSSLKLVDANDNTIDSVTNVTSGTTTEFAAVDFATPLITINKDQKVVLKVVGDLKVDQSLATETPATIQVTVTAAEAERASDQGGQPSTGSATGDTQYIYRVVAAQWKVLEALASATRGENEPTSTLNAVFKVQITAQRGDVYIPQSGAFTASSTGAATVDMGSPDVTPISGVETSGAYYVVRNGNTGVLEVKFAKTPDSWTPGWYQVKLNTMKWDNDETPSTEMSTTFPGTVETKTLTNSVYISK